MTCAQSDLTRAPEVDDPTSETTFSCAKDDTIDEAGSGSRRMLRLWVLGGARDAGLAEGLLPDELVDLPGLWPLGPLVWHIQREERDEDCTVTSWSEEAAWIAAPSLRSLCKRPRWGRPRSRHPP